MTEQAKKYDENKPLLLTWPRSFLVIGMVSSLGKAKYGKDTNYLMGDTLGVQRPLEAAMRHIMQFMSGQTNDNESGLCHLAHAACSILMSLEIFLSRPEKDDRFYTTEWHYENCKPTKES